MLRFCCSLPALHLLDHAAATQDMASVGRFVLHAPVYFLGFEDLLAVCKRNMHAFVDRGIVFALKGENVCQKASIRASLMGCLPDWRPHSKTAKGPFKGGILAQTQLRAVTPPRHRGKLSWAARGIIRPTSSVRGPTRLHPWGPRPAH